MKTTGYITTITVFAFISLFWAQPCLSGDDPIFQSAIETAVDQALDAWIKDDTTKLVSALEKLTLNETYLMVTGQTDPQRSYLGRMPGSLNQNFNSVGAYLFLLRKEKEGVNLWPVSLFEGNKFQFEQGGK
ncbi:MAG: hypothetical protein Q8P24_15355 [Desulfobacterales bacterium]|nr:hypothetical protein [Desulfobacterales bacterium]